MRRRSRRAKPRISSFAALAREAPRERESDDDLP
jgi:hypothetical protein